MTEPVTTGAPFIARRAAYAAALAAFQAKVPKVVKGNRANAGQYGYDYADLSDVTYVVLPLLAAHGLAWSAKPTTTEHGFVLDYSLTHAEGHVESGVYPLPDPAKTAPQQLGSAISYARRYTLCSLTGVAPGGDDDDGAKAQDTRATAVKPQSRQEHDRMVRDVTSNPKRTERVKGEAAKATDAWTETVAQPPDTSVDAHAWYVGWAGRVASCPSLAQLKGLHGELSSERDAGHATDEMRTDGDALCAERAADLRQPAPASVPS